jgi:hypothetical protein
VTDQDQPGEELDENTDGIEYPPDRFLDPDADGGVEPEVWEAPPRAVDDGVELAGEPDVVALDDEGALVGEAVDDDPDVGPLADDDQFTGDETTRDYPAERVPEPAEEAAVHRHDQP